MSAITITRDDLEARIVYEWQKCQTIKDWYAMTEMLGAWVNLAQLATTSDGIEIYGDFLVLWSLAFERECQLRRAAA